MNLRNRGFEPECVGLSSTWTVFFLRRDLESESAGFRPEESGITETFRCKPEAWTFSPKIRFQDTFRGDEGGVVYKIAVGDGCGSASVGGIKLAYLI